MAIQQYLCPECGVALQSAQDVIGKSVRCLGCQAVFTARRAPTITREPPPPRRAEPPPAPKPKRQPRHEIDEDRYTPELPPIPRDSKVPVALVVGGGALLAAVGLTVFLVIAFRGKKPDDTTSVAKVESKPARVEAKNPPPDVVKSADPPGRTRTEEEEVAAIPAKQRPPRKAPDLSELLPNTPQFPSKDPPAGETRPKVAPTKPADPPAKPDTRPDAVEPPARADGPIPADLLTRLKAATVFIKVSAGHVQGTGSGFVLKVDGNTALVVTNNHVANAGGHAGPVGAAQYELVFHSGRKAEFSLKGELVVGDVEHDLALLRVSGVLGQPDFPAALNTTDKAPLAETMPVYIFGFPFGEMLATSKANPAVTIGKGTISSLREDDAGDAAVIQLDGDVNPGNSGGPVVDARGRLVGVTVAKVKGTNIGLAIPPIELKRMLAGRLGNLEFRIARAQAPNVEIDVHGTLLDPMDRVASCSLLVARADELKEKPAVGAGGQWAPLAGAEKVEMKVAGRGVNGTVKLPMRERDRKEIEFLFQPACVDRDGKTTYFPPVTKILREGQPDVTIPFGPRGPNGPPGSTQVPPGPPAAGPGVPGGIRTPPPLPPPPNIPRPGAGGGPGFQGGRPGGSGTVPRGPGQPGG
jgi:S1-C subfamily serine protease